MNAGRFIKQRIDRAIAHALSQSTQAPSPETNVAAALNIDRSGHTTVVATDGKVFVVHRDGETDVPDPE